MSLIQWAEVLSADAFSAFEDAGLDNEKVCFSPKKKIRIVSMFEEAGSTFPLSHLPMASM
jgi:Zn-dependent oligopeptidase